VGTIKSRVARARDTLMAILEGRNPDEDDADGEPAAIQAEPRRYREPGALASA
jgi:hypothetical protein